MSVQVAPFVREYIGGKLDSPDPTFVLDLNRLPILVEDTKSDNKQEELKKEFNRFISLAGRQLA